MVSMSFLVQFGGSKKLILSTLLEGIRVLKIINYCFLITLMNHNGLMLQTALWVRGAIKEHTEERKQETKYLFKDFVLNNAMGFLNSTFF